VVGPRMVLVLGFDLHCLWALSDKVLVLPALVADARAPPSILVVRVHALELPAQQCKILLASTLNSSSSIDIRQDKDNCLEDRLVLVLGPKMRARHEGQSGSRFLLAPHDPPRAT
jgi:hypothetical protein